MDAPMKQRLVGAVVLVALGVIFLPMLVKGPAPDSGVADVSIDIPEPPKSTGATQTIDLPLEAPAGAPAGGATGMPAPTPAPATAPEPAPDQAGPGAAAGDYVVAFGSYASVTDADKVIAALRDAGLRAYREATTVAGKAAQRVRIGPFVDRAQAESARLTAGTLNPQVEAKVVALDADTPAPAAVAMPLPAAVAVAPAKPTAATKPEPTAPQSVPPASAKSDAKTAAIAKSDAQAVAKPAPADTPVAVPKPAPAAGTGFAVQVGAFADVAAATGLRDKLRAAGFNVFTDVVQTEGGKRTRVRVGPAMTRAEADALKAQLKAKANIDGIVRPHP